MSEVSLIFIIGGISLVATILVRLWGIFSLRQYFTYFLKNPPLLLGFLGILLAGLGYAEFFWLVFLSQQLQVVWFILRLFKKLARFEDEL